MSRTLHLFGTDWGAMMVPIQVIRWYRMQCYDGTDSCAIVVPIRRYCHNMRQKKEWDKRVNELLGGLHKMVGAISSMRNINSDAHGAGSARIEIKEREAILVAHSSMIMAEYWLSVLENKH